MMHVFYCPECRKYFYTNNKARAVCCDHPMYELNVKFTDFVKMSPEERKNCLNFRPLAH